MIWAVLFYILFGGMTLLMSDFARKENNYDNQN